MGGGSSCTCNVRVCNYNKKGGYTVKQEGAKIDTSTQVNDLKTTLNKFMVDKDSQSEYFKTGVKATPNETVSQAALNKLRNTISSVTPIAGLTLNSFCVNLTDSYNEPSTTTTTQDTTESIAKFTALKPSTLEGYTMIKPKPTYSTIICVIAAVIMFTFIGYLIYRYINCPCRKRREKELQEAEKSLEYTT